MIDLKGASRDECVRYIVAQHEMIARQEQRLAAQQARIVTLEVQVTQLAARVTALLVALEAATGGEGNSTVTPRGQSPHRFLPSSDASRESSCSIFASVETPLSTSSLR